ncbi:MAG: hypothetical protein EXR59_05110 [Dehalococcoidia bacterium]|nr:hypothetical protein [Dehalococcoidia bacterium]
MAISRNLSLNNRVVYVGTGKKNKGPRWLTGWWLYEDERVWRQRLAKEMEDMCAEMEKSGLKSSHVVPVLNAESMMGSWTEGVWMYFTKS